MTASTLLACCTLLATISFSTCTWSWFFDFMEDSTESYAKHELDKTDSLTSAQVGYVPTENNVKISRGSFVYLEKFNAYYKVFSEPKHPDMAAKLCAFQSSTLFVPSSVEELIAVFKLSDIKYMYINLAKGLLSKSDSSYRTSEGRLAGQFYMKLRPVTKDSSEMKCLFASKEHNEYQKKYCNGVPLPFVCKRTAVMHHLLVGLLSPPRPANFCQTHDIDYVYNDALGSCYKFHHEYFSWPSAIATCAREGAHLVTLNSQQEVDHLVGVNDMLGSSNLWTNLVDPFRRGFMTPEGVSVKATGFARFASGRSNTDAGNRCLELKSSGELSDLACETSRPFVCEIEVQKGCCNTTVEAYAAARAFAGGGGTQSTGITNSDTVIEILINQRKAEDEAAAKKLKESSAEEPKEVD